MTQNKPNPSKFANLPRWAYLILTGLILSGVAAGIYVLFHWYPTWEQGILFGLLTFIVLMLVLMLRDGEESKREASDEPYPDAATEEEQQAAIVHLSALPHVRLLSDGSLFDYLLGSHISPCRCGKYSPLHLMVRYGKGRRHSIALVSRGALAQFLAVQDAVAAHLASPEQKGGQA